MKSKIFMKKALALTCTVSLVAQSAGANVLNATPEDYVTNGDYDAKNFRVRQWMKIPFYFSVPRTSILPLPSELATTPVKGVSPVIVYDYLQMNNKRLAENPNSLGLRLLTVKGTDDRTKSSRALGASGLIQTGDVLLSFRREWFGTLRYAQLQLGISHAGVAYIDEKGSLRNIDMPMDAETVGKDNRLLAPHYKEAPVLHVVRLTDMTDDGQNSEEVKTRVKNIQGWIDRLMAKAPYSKGNLRFNKDYANPSYGRGDWLRFIGFNKSEALSFVGELGRLAFGAPLQEGKTLDMFCSEFAWSLLSLRNCDPNDSNVQQAFASEAQPACIDPTFAPMGVFGNYLDQGQGTLSDGIISTKTIGLMDGPLLALDALDVHGETRRRMVNKILASATGKGKHISSGHRAVEEGILSIFPQFYDVLKMYYNLMDRAPGVVTKALSASENEPEESENPDNQLTAEQIETLEEAEQEQAAKDAEEAPFQPLIDAHVDYAAQNLPSSIDFKRAMETSGVYTSDWLNVALMHIKNFALFLEKAWVEIGEGNIPSLRGIIAKPGTVGIRTALNQLPPSNYSPTAFMIHGMMSPESNVKKVNYVGTIVYSKPIKTKMNAGDKNLSNVDLYTEFEKLVKGQSK